VNPKSWTQHSGIMEKKISYHAPLEIKKEIIELYLLGYSCTSISKVYKMSSTQICLLTRRYRAIGYRCLEKHSGSIRYSIDFKRRVVRDILKNVLTLDRAAIKYGINVSTAGRWFHQMEKGGFGALKDPKQERLKKYTMQNGEKQSSSSLAQTEREKELERQLEDAKMEIEYLKKLAALVQEREKRESSK